MAGTQGVQFKADEGRSRKILERSKVEIMEKAIKNRVHQNSDASGNNLRNSSVDADGGADLSADSFFEKAAYKGAVKADNEWTKGWTKL